MSEFDRREKARLSIRRPRKSPAPQPPSSEALQTHIPIHLQKPPTSTEDVSSIIKRLLSTRRDFATTSPQNDSTRPTSVLLSPITTPSVAPRVVSAIPKSQTEQPEDDSRSALLAIQKHINAIEFNQKTEPQPQIIQPVVRKTRYDEMESLMNTGISDLATNKHDTDDEDDSMKFQRGGGTRSSVQGVPTAKFDANKLRNFRPVVRTASDTKQHELIRNIFKTKKEDEVKQVKKFVSSGDDDEERKNRYMSFLFRDKISETILSSMKVLSV